MAQLVEHLLAKEKVAGSNPVFRSKISLLTPLFCEHALLECRNDLVVQPLQHGITQRVVHARLDQFSMKPGLVV